MLHNLTENRREEPDGFSLLRVENAAHSIPGMRRKNAEYFLSGFVPGKPLLIFVCMFE